MIEQRTSVPEEVPGSLSTSSFHTQTRILKTKNQPPRCRADETMGAVVHGETSDWRSLGSKDSRVGEKRPDRLPQFRASLPYFSTLEARLSMLATPLIAWRRRSSAVAGTCESDESRGGETQYVGSSFLIRAPALDR